MQPGALPALQDLNICMPQLQATLPASWGASPGVLPALQTLQLNINVVGQLPPEWASGFHRLEMLILSDPQCSPDDRLRAATASAQAQTQTETVRRAGAATEVPAPSPLTAAKVPAGSCPPMTLPPEWAGTGSFPRLTGLWLAGLRLSGTIPATWLQPGGLPSITAL